MRTALQRAGIASLAVALAAPATALADGRSDGSYFAPAPGKQPGDIVIDTPNERTNLNIALISSAAGLGLVISAVGLYFNVEANSNASDLGSPGSKGITWDAAHQDKQNQLNSENTDLTACYIAGGALLVGAAVALIVTSPGSTRSVIHPHSGGAEPVIAPTSGGAVVGGKWSF